VKRDWNADGADELDGRWIGVGVLTGMLDCPHRGYVCFLGWGVTTGG
jgi:hypothetical protein